ncbi:MAG: NADH:flavin oxidoreductase [Muribaculaceae bacterium]|nr:NADH:flavin oxidoreductase [Muribaculaceae bacterium]
MSESKLFTEGKLGPITLRNRTIRSAAFEGMAENNSPSEALKAYHTSVAAGGVGMTTVAYAAVMQSGLSFPRQLWLRKEIVPGLRDLTDSIHSHGAKASVQLGHCGNMSHKKICGETPVGACTGFNMYSPTFVRGLKKDELKDIARQFGNAVKIAMDGGFDCVEVHAGHGYLISQFLSPYTNHRSDEYGGPLSNRMHFMQMCIEEVLKAADGKIAVVAKTNMRDGFKGGLEIDDCITVARELERLGLDGLVLSGGFVSKAPMYVMRGEMPIKTLTHYMDCWWLKYGVKMAGKMMIPTVPFKELYFLDDALRFRKELKLPLIYVGGAVSRSGIDKVLDSGFDFVQMGRALVNEPDFVNRMCEGEERCGCDHTNYCIGRMYTIDMQCHKHVKDLPKKLEKEISDIRKRDEKRNSSEK